MTNEDFVKSIYPNAYFSRGAIFTEHRVILWFDEYGRWYQEWDDPIAIARAWEQLATAIQYKFLKKLES